MTDLNDIIGKSQARNRSPRISPLLSDSVLDKAFQLSPRRTYRKLHPVVSCHYLPTLKGGVLLHTRGRRLPCTVCGDLPSLRSDLASVHAPRYRETVQSMDSSSVAQDISEPGSYCGTFLPAGQAPARAVLRVVRNCWSWHASHLASYFIRFVVCANISCSILSAILYWYVWTVALPWWGGYKLEEEVDVLDDGTTITKLVKVSR